MTLNEETTMQTGVQKAVTRDELDLSRADDLKLFLESAEDVYADAVQYQAVAKTEDYRSLNFDDIKGVEVFDALFGLLKELQRHILSCKEAVKKKDTVEDSVVEKMQELYDSMVMLRDLVSDTYKNRRTENLRSNVGGVRPLEREQCPVETKQKVDSDQKDRTTAVTLSERKGDDTKEKEGFFVSIDEAVAAAEQRLNVIKARVLNCVPLTARDPEVTKKMEGLTVCLRRLKGIKDRVRTSRTKVIDIDILKQALGNYAQLVEEIVKKAEEIEQEIVEQQSEVTMVAHSMMPGKTSQVRPVDTPTCLHRKVPERAPELPSEAAVSFLVKRVFEDQFYTETERAKVQELCEAFHRSVAVGEPIASSNEKYSDLSHFVYKIEAEPDIKELSERVKRIMRRVTTGLPFDSELLRKTRILEQEFQQLLNDPASSDQSIRDMYRDLLGFVRGSKREWLTVCGMHIPLAGPRGNAMARSLRETLLIERDRNSELVRDPRKQILVDKLIRKLSSLPSTGLSEEVDIPEIAYLMSAIDVSGQQGKLVNPGGESICVDCLDEEDEEATVFNCFGAQNPKHKVIDISTDDAESTIEITVAEKTKQRIAQHGEKVAAKSIPQQQPIQPVPSLQSSQDEIAVVARTEKIDPVNRAVPTHAPRITAVDPVHEKRSLTRLYLSDPVYQDFIAEHYTSAAAFERILDTVITQIEAKTVDAFERWLHEEHRSPFAFLEEMPVGRVLELVSSNELRQILLEENIKYETFLAWSDLIAEMQSVVGSDMDMKFGELYARWMIETEMIYVAEHTTT